MALSLKSNLLTPIPMCFALGVFCKVIHGGIKIPKELYYSIAIFLLMSIGFIGGHELAKEVGEHGVKTIWKPATATLVLGCLTPVTAFVILRYLCRMSVADSAGIAAHYGSTSAVTFAVADAFVNSQGAGPDKFLPTLVTILECPGIAIALALGAVLSKASRSAGAAHDSLTDEQPESRIGEALYEVITGQSIMLMGGLLVIGFVSTSYMSPHGFEPFHDFFYSKGMIFRGALCIFLLEMGLVAGERLGDLLKVGPVLVAFGVLWPIIHGFLGVWLGHMAGLNLGGATVLGAIVSSASYIAAPPAVRLTLPEANPTLSITAALAITFPFNIALGIPIYFSMAKFVYGP
ncbi:MAG: sodium-dependent bicarbonate transport family permease [Planctomycetes bacterium]|nr:sodium-dependent bicarbonate transport family permease [Planctomycetota bacterium]